MSVSTPMFFLAQVPLYNEVKPYRLKYLPPSGLPQSNIQLEQHEISIRDVRTLDPGLDLQKDGFAFIPSKSAMNYEDFDDDENIKRIYLKEIAESLKTPLNALRVQIFEHLVRKAHQLISKYRVELTLEDPKSKS
jgi:hypothetical protein